MATIKSTIALHDGMTSALQSINRAMNIVLNSFESMQRVSSKAIDTKSIQTARNELARAATSFNNIEKEINENTTAQNKFNNSLKSSSGHANALWGKIKGIVATYVGVQAAGGIINMADQLTSVSGRLDLINDGLQTTAQLQEKIYQAAQRSRGSYLGMANTVTRLNMLAGDAFKSNDEAIAFAETLNKMFVISKASNEEMASATLQLTQALSSGVLQGEELRAVRESAPMVVDAIAKYMGVAKGEIKKLASEGKITADIVKNALFTATGEVNKQFESMPYTWGQVWTTIKNYSLKAFTPIFKAISAITSNKKFIAFANEVGNVIGNVARFMQRAFNALKPVLNWLYNTIASIYNFFKSNWSLIAPIVIGVAFAFGVLKLATMGYNIVMLISKGITAAVAFVQGVMAAKAALAAGATFKQTVAQWGLNSALLACPITWIVLGIIALIAVIYLAVAAMNKWAGTSLSATGIVMGAFYALGAFIWNILAVIWNAIASLVEFFVNVWTNPMYSVKKLFVNLATTLLDLCISMTKGWDEMATNFVNAMIDAVNGVLKGWNWLVDKLGVVGEKLGLGKATMFEHTTSITSDLEAAKADLQSWLGAKPEDYWEAPKMETKVLGEAWNNGYKAGEGLADKVGGFFSGDDLTGAINDALGQGGGANDIGKALSGNLGSSPALDAIKGNSGDIADNTADIAASNEELDFIRDMAEREAINRYTLTDLKVEVSNTNNINNKVDEQDMLDKICAAVYDGVRSGAQGVYT